MFEKEAEEYTVEHHCKNCWMKDADVDSKCTGLDFCGRNKDWQRGAEFGYNKAMDEMQEQGLALQSDMDKTIEQNIALKKELEKANEWHYVKDGDLPKEEGDYLFYLYDKETKFTFYEVLGIARTYADRDDLYIESMIWTLEDVIAWKEIVPPNIKEIKEND